MISTNVEQKIFLFSDKKLPVREREIEERKPYSENELGLYYFCRNIEFLLKASIQQQTKSTNA